MIKAYLVDDHGLIRMGMRQLLEAEADIEVVGETGDGWSALSFLNDNPVDVLLLDLSMPLLSGTEVLRRILEAQPNLSVLVVSMYSEEQFGPAVIGMGAAGYLPKDRADSQLVIAVRTVAAGATFLSRRVTAQPAAADEAPHHGLTARELQVFMRLIEGQTVGNIAAELGLGVSTVSTYVGRIREKLGVESVVDIVRYAYQHGLVG